MQWMVLLLVVVALLPQTWLEAHDGAVEARSIQKHLAAFTFLIAFIEVWPYCTMRPHFNVADPDLSCLIRISTFVA